ncbi:MAG: hypothetical protein IKJ73_07800 [Lachnospiraceae bacterium]|nr:hypothetical protein [Lachnospiraceae bacterium]
MRTYKIGFIIVFLIIIALPFVGLIWYEEPETTENKVLTPKPVLVDDEGFNINFLPELDAYYSDHFAYRQELVTANAVVKANVFGESSEELAIVGQDGWLYLKVSLEDYQGTNVSSNRGLNNMAKSLSLMQGYVEGLGGSFVFVCAPNKNTLYPEYMPYYYQVINEDNNLDLLTPKLYKYGINYVDAKALFEAESDILYHVGDSHWNNKGAAMVQDLILDEAGVDHTDFTTLSYKTYDTFQGDIDKILYPLNRHNEIEYDYSEHLFYKYLTPVTDAPIVEQNVVETTNMSTDGDKLLCFRDSFGNTLLPFLAHEFEYCYFSKNVPYRMDYMYDKSTNVCVVELVERNLIQLVRFAPVMPAPLRTFGETCTEYNSECTTLNISSFESYYKLSGQVDCAYVSDDSPIYIRLSSGSNIYVVEAFPVDEDYKGGAVSDYGYVAYLNQTSLPVGEYTVEIITENGVYYNMICDTNIIF